MPAHVTHYEFTKQSDKTVHETKNPRLLYDVFAIAVSEIKPEVYVLQDRPWPSCTWQTKFICPFI